MSSGSRHLLGFSMDKEELQEQGVCLELVVECQVWEEAEVCQEWVEGAVCLNYQEEWVVKICKI